VHGGSAFVSWNGATEVASWQLVEDGNRTRRVARAGFETELDLSPQTKSVTVDAIDGAGRAIGTSPTVSV
jgi:hypothetical protein